MARTATREEAGSAEPARAAAGRTLGLEFTATPAEYFRIWIVNLFFTLATLGIYSAWAKVRKKRYFYGSTRLDGDSFDYFGSPKAILKGRIVAFALFAVYVVAGELYPMSRFAFWALIVVVLPWLVLRSLLFNATNSAWRGLRFNFVAAPGEAARIYAGRLILVVLTLGIAMPWFIARAKSYIVSHHRYGAKEFSCEVSGRKLFGIYFVGGLIMSLFGIPAPFLTPLAAQWGLPEALEWLKFVLPLAPLYLGYALAFAYMNARTANLVWQGTQGEGVRFHSALSAKKLAGLYVTNVLAIIGTAGLLVPWAVVRTLRYRLETFTVTVNGAPVVEAAAGLPRVGAAGQEVGEIFNLDVAI